MESNAEELIERARNGDAGAFDEIVERYSRMVWGVVRSYRLGRADSEDVVQGVWLSFVQHLHQIRDAERLPGWLATTARRECLAAIRRTDRMLPTDDVRLMRIADGEGSEGVHTRAEAAERLHAVREAMAAIGERCRQLLALLAADPPIPYAEIAVLTNLTVGGIGPTRNRCLEKVRRHRSISRLLHE